MWTADHQSEFLETNQETSDSWRIGADAKYKNENVFMWVSKWISLNSFVWFSTKILYMNLLPTVLQKTCKRNNSSDGFIIFKQLQNESS